MHGAATVLGVWSPCMNAWCSYSTRRLITVYERMVQLQHFLAIEQQVLFACSYSTRRLIIVCAVCMQLQYFSAFDHRVCTVCMMQRQYFSGGEGGGEVARGSGGWGWGEKNAYFNQTRRNTRKCSGHNPFKQITNR